MTGKIAKLLYQRGVQFALDDPSWDAVSFRPSSHDIYWDHGTTTATSSFTFTTNVPVPVHVYLADEYRVQLGEYLRLELPDGARVEVDRSGSWRVVTDDQRVLYKGSSVREFNRYVNASDIMEEFIAFAGSLGLDQRQLLDLPVELFLQFLILQAAAADGDELPDVPPLPEHPKLRALTAPRRHRSRCLDCGRFVPQRHADQGLFFCNVLEVQRYAARALAADDKERQRCLQGTRPGWPRGSRASRSSCGSARGRSAR